jgi:ABC-type phosphate/phosphonate transport system substrate-binding protein
MYDLAELRPATGALWASLAKALGVSGRLTRGDDWSGPWRNPSLLFSQTCGYPFTHEFAGQLAYVATPHYAAPGCMGAHYCSLIMARRNQPLADFAGGVAAINTPDSMSGMLALKLVFQPLASNGQFFSRNVITGGHAASMQAVQMGQADVCAIDCVTFALLKRHRPSAVENLVAVARSDLVPGLPYVTRGGDVLRLRHALEAVMQDSHLADVRKALLLEGYSVLPADAYDIIPQRELAMEKAGGLQL